MSYYDNYDYDDCDSDEDEQDEEQDVSSTSYRVVRKARKSFLVGDLIKVVSGFTYEPDGGPRTGYFSYESRVAFGPNHDLNSIGKGSNYSNWSRSKKGSYEAYHGPKPQAVIERDELLAQAHGYTSSKQGSTTVSTRNTETREQLETLEAVIAVWEGKYGVALAWDAHQVLSRIEALEARVTKALEARDLYQAEVGATVTWRGTEYTRGDTFTKCVYFSDLEYNGDLCDAEAQTWISLTPTNGSPATSMRLPKYDYRLVA